MNRQALATDWLSDSLALNAQTIALRRAIHREPELGLKTPRTLAKVMAALEGLPLSFKTGPNDGTHRNPRRRAARTNRFAAR